MAKPKKPEKSKTRPQRKPRATLSLVVTTAIIAVGLLVGYRVLSNRPEPSTAVSPEVLALGEERFASACAACHGAEGQGGAAANVPALNGSMHAWHHSDEQLIAQIRGGGMSMPAVGAEWSDEEIAAVISYFKQWWSPQQRRGQQGTLGE